MSFFDRVNVCFIERILVVCRDVITYAVAGRSWRFWRPFPILQWSTGWLAQLTSMYAVVGVILYCSLPRHFSAQLVEQIFRSSCRQFNPSA